MSKQVGARRQKYSVATLEHAADMVRSKAISLNMAARQYCIPKTTIQNAVANRYGSHRLGKATILTEAEETRVAEWAIGMAKIGYGRTRQELATTVKKIIEDDGRLNPFKDNKPGRAWMDGFIRRHPSLSPRTTIQLGKERALISPEKIARWFSEFKNYIENELGDKTLLTDPTRIYNADETDVSLCMKGTQVIGIKGASVQYHYGNSDKTQLTVMAACSASAHYLPPMIIFPGQRFSYNPLEGFQEAALGRSTNGWMDSEVFNNWLENVFVPGVTERNVKKPVLLLIDGHVTHVTMAASDICRKHGIELYCLLEHASHVLQPLDLRLFSALKRNWRQAVRNWQSENIGEYVTKVTFARVFKNAWYRSTTVDVAVKGFAAAGLFPLDPSVVLQSMKIEPSQLFASPRSSEEKSTDKAVEPSTENDVDSLLVPESEGNRRPTEKESTDNVVEPSTENDVDPLPVPESEGNPRSTEQKSADQAEEPSTENDVDRLPVSESGEPQVAIDKQVEPPAETDEARQPGNPLTASDLSMTGSVTSERGCFDKVETGTTTGSPFSKHLVVPMPKVQTKPKTVRRINTPWKAITGTNYRKMMEEKKAKKDEEEKAKEKRKQDRIEKRKLKEEEKIKNKEEKEAKRQKKAEEKRNKRALREKLIRVLESGSESEEEMFVNNSNCFTCELPYSTDYIECSRCFRRFHFDCVEDEYIDIDGLPFECKYC